ncbi:ATP-binding protein [Candidatus Gottesmanbacteria bacterium]|nr:ATP-binding protein [Candidatus Gottesmanbacteria bacterium]
MYYFRQLYPYLEAELETKEMTILTGMRRVGKTTALRHLYGFVKSDNKTLLDLENPLHRKLFEEEQYDNVWYNLSQFGITNVRKAYIFVDEVQYLPEVSKVVKYLYDHWDVKFILTGSSSFYLRNLFPESLSGRKILFEMFPLNFSEFLVFRETSRVAQKSWSARALQKNRISYERLIALYDEYMEFGGFPSVVLEENYERKRVLLSEIFTSYFEKDAKNLADFRDMSKLRDLILLLIPRVGNRIEILKLAATLSVSRETVYAYLSFLEQTYFISLLPKFSGSIDRQAAGSKKVFLCDSGLLNILGRASQGQMFEQSVFQNIRGAHTLHYYSKDGASEIDFIVDQSCAMEAKLSMSGHDVTTLSRRSAPLKLTEQYVVTHEYADHPKAILATDL